MKNANDGMTKGGGEKKLKTDLNQATIVSQ